MRLSESNAEMKAFAITSKAEIERLSARWRRIKSVPAEMLDFFKDKMSIEDQSLKQLMKLSKKSMAFSMEREFWGSFYLLFEQLLAELTDRSAEVQLRTFGELESCFKAMSEVDWSVLKQEEAALMKELKGNKAELWTRVDLYKQRIEALDIERFEAVRNAFLLYSEFQLSNCHRLQEFYSRLKEMSLNFVPGQEAHLFYEGKQQAVTAKDEEKTEPITARDFYGEFEVPEEEFIQKPKIVIDLQKEVIPSDPNDISRAMEEVNSRTSSFSSQRPSANRKTLRSEEGEIREKDEENNPLESTEERIEMTADERQTDERQKDEIQLTKSQTDEETLEKSQTDERKLDYVASVDLMEFHGVLHVTEHYFSYFANGVKSAESKIEITNEMKKEAILHVNNDDVLVEAEGERKLALAESEIPINLVIHLKEENDQILTAFQFDSILDVEASCFILTAKFATDRIVRKIQTKPTGLWNPTDKSLVFNVDKASIKDLKLMVKMQVEGSIESTCRVSADCQFSILNKTFATISTSESTVKRKTIVHMRHE